MSSTAEVTSPQTNAIYIVSDSNPTWDIWQYKNSSWTKLGFVNAYEPIPSLNYWCEEGAHLTPRPESNDELNSRTWYYEVQMNYSSFVD